MLQNSGCLGFGLGCSWRLILSNFTSSDSLILLSMASWNATHQVCSGGFLVSSPNYSILIVGCLLLKAESQLEADILTLVVALNVVTSMPLQISNILVSNNSILKLIHSADPTCS
ncbi:uncharacterized protein LOC120265854 isoform X1 [Dioscorea cayenensis subsp. rotundata]|uniref:Uncharacterized protein LOC120265854 isoform X1 n=1 Tax=Dioscorea cayennensis subsp. rotundata TaxID=55577 RepID=A0AB40BQL4_DIOCR|nr:uncharacterized protein LOC120265854 isoform X1 [Dioscorea cayenensis subsp. rotundata]